MWVFKKCLARHSGEVAIAFVNLVLFLGVRHGIDKARLHREGTYVTGFVDRDKGYLKIPRPRFIPVHNSLDGFFAGLLRR